MPRAATDVMQSIIFSSVLDAIEALKASSKGLPNQLLRDVQAIHPNVTFADLPKELQDAIAASTRAAFTQMLKEGYAVGPRQAAPARVQPGAATRHPPRERRGPAPERRPRRPEGPPKGPEGPGPGKGPGKGPRRPRPMKGKPRLS